MRSFALIAAVVLPAVLLPSAVSAQAPWPPPPGMSAGEYAARYGHRVRPPGDYRYGPPRRRYDPPPGYYDRPRRSRRDRYYDDDDYF